MTNANSNALHAPRRLLDKVADFMVTISRRFVEDRGVQTAGSLTFTTLLSMVPLITVALSLTTAFPVFDQAIGALQTYVVEHYLPDAAGVRAITEQVSAFTEKAGRLTAIGLAFLLVTSLMLMLTIDEAMNRIFRVQRRRPLAQRVLMYWSVLTLGPLLIGGSLSMTSYMVGASLGLMGDMGAVTTAVLRVVPFLFTVAALTMLYLVVPYRRIDLPHALVGAILAGILFELAKRGFAFYIAKFPTYTMIYGAFATVPIFLLWLYLSWLVVLVGATLTAMLPGYRAADVERHRSPGHDLLDALAVLAVLARGQSAGEVRSTNRIATRVRLMPYRCERVLERCSDLGWVAKTDRDGWLLTRDADDIRVADVYRAFVLDPEAKGGVHEALERLSVPIAEHWKHVEGDLSLSLRRFAAAEEKAEQAG